MLCIVEWLPSDSCFSSKFRFRFCKVVKLLRIMPPKKKAKTESTQEKEQSSNLVWSDDEVELLLGVVQAFASEKEFEGVEWESVKSKYEDIRKEFVCLYDQKGLKEHDPTIFTRERIASKVKDLRKKYKKAVDLGRRSGGGRTVATFFDVCNGIWGGCPATKSLEHGVDSTEGFTFNAVILDDEDEERGPNEQTVEQNAPPLELISPGPPVNDVASVGNVDRDTEEEEGDKRIPGQKTLIEHLKHKRHSKLSKIKSTENQQLAVMREDLNLKKTMMSKMEKMDEEHNKTLNKFANTMENLSQAVLTALAGKQASYPWQQQPLQHQCFPKCFQPGGQLQSQGIQGRQSEYMPQQSVIKSIDPNNPL